MIKKCLILSDGPVPTPEHTKVEGGGLRCWGLAKGITENSPNTVEVTVAYNESYKADKYTDNYQGIKIATWSDSDLQELVKGFDTIIVSYCMGNLSLNTSDYVQPAQQLILDCYVPIYIEMSARKSANLQGEFDAFNFELKRWKKVLSRGDLFLCANQAQKSFYEGILAAVGRINPVSYGHDMILVVPYGIYRNKPAAKVQPVKKLLTNKKSLKVLWFGGIYPWFDLTKLMQAISEVNKETPAELTVVGAKNPFNRHPDFIKKSEEIENYVTKHKLQSIIHMIDWVNFNDRADWYLDSDIVVVVNEEGPENKLAWRTRLVDFVWADLPILTNGGDPLGERLIAEDAARRLNSLDVETISKSIIDLAGDTGAIQKYRKNITKVRDELYWDITTKSLCEAIVNGVKAVDLPYQTDTAVRDTASQDTVTTLKTKFYKLPAYYRKYGARVTALTVKTVLQSRLERVTRKPDSRAPKTVVISHQLDLSGAPYVLMDIVSEIIKLPSLRKQVEFRTFNPVAKDNLRALSHMGVKPKIYHNKDTIFSFVSGDTVILNSFAFSPITLKSILAAVDRGTIDKLLWYGHEATPKGFVPPKIARQVERLLNEGKISIYATARDCMEKYIEYFGTEKNISRMPYRFDMPLEEFRPLDADKFKKLSFVLPGTVSDGRKGQMPILYAFIDFYDNYYRKNPENYRDFKLTFVGLDKDFLSEQIIRNGSHSLDGHFAYYPKVTRQKNLEITKDANVTLCYSLQEALPLFVYEGMAYGHPLIRNESSGMKEQLFVGKNGWKVSTDDYEGLVATLEEVLNIQKTSNEKLAEMSHESISLAQKATQNKYTLLNELS